MFYHPLHPDLRKNNYDVLKSIGEGVLNHAKNVMSTIKTKNYTPSGRINKDTIILKAYLR